MRDILTTGERTAIYPPPVSSPIQLGAFSLAGLSVVFTSRHRKLSWRALLGKGIKLHIFNERESNERVSIAVCVGLRLRVKKLAENECSRSGTDYTARPDSSVTMGLILRCGVGG